MDIIKLEKRRGKEAEELWRERIEGTIQWRKDYRFGDKMMDRGKRRYLGEHWDQRASSFEEDVNSDNPSDRITVNLTGSTVDDFVPFLVRQSPKFQLKPRNEAAIDSAKVASAYFNWAWKEYRFQPQLRRTVQDGLVQGVGVLKTGYNFQLEQSMDESGRVSYNDNIRWDAPYICRVNPKRFYFEPGAPQFDLDSARWCFEVIPQTLQDIIENEMYSSAVRNRIKSGKETVQTLRSYLMQADERLDEDDDFERSVLPSQQLCVTYEVWDKKYDMYWLFAAGVDKPLMEESNPYPYLDGFPYKQWKYREVNDETGAPGVPEVVKDQQDELNRVRTTEFRHRREHGLRKYLIREDGIDESEIVRLLDSHSKYIKVREFDAVKSLESPSLPNDNYMIDGVIQQDYRQLTGQDELQRGGSLPSRTSAREVQARQSIMGTKTAGRSTLVDELVDGVGRQVLQHVQANLESDQIMRIDGPREESGYLWLEMKPEDIRKEYDLEFESTSKSESTPEQEQAARAAIFERAVMANPVMQPTGKQIDLGEMFIWTMEAHDQTVELDRFIIEAPPQQVPTPGDVNQANSDSATSATAGASMNLASTVR